MGNPSRRLPTVTEHVQQAIKIYPRQQAKLQFFARVLPKKHACRTLSSPKL
jgi:hypothetical protein